MLQSQRPLLSPCCCWCRRQHVAWLGAPAGMAVAPDGPLVVCDMAKVGPLGAGCSGKL